jgi:hypothetical protein
LTSEPLVVLNDASVLYPAPLRDLCVRVAADGVCGAHRSRRIEEEWIRGVPRDRPGLARAQLERTVRLMEAAVPGAVVEGWEDALAGLALPDPDDRHALAVVACGANLLVTANVRNFPRDGVARHGIEVRRPDAFVLDLLQRAPDATCAVVRAHRAAPRSPPRSVEPYLATLAATGLRRSVRCLRELGVELQTVPSGREAARLPQGSRAASRPGRMRSRGQCPMGTCPPSFSKYCRNAALSCDFM